jgi:hypothetical protein
VGLPIPGVRVRIAEFKTSSDGAKVYYDILTEGNHKATKVEPGKVKNHIYIYIYYFFYIIIIIYI